MAEENFNWLENYLEIQSKKVDFTLFHSYKIPSHLENLIPKISFLKEKLQLSIFVYN